MNARRLFALGIVLTAWAVSAASADPFRAIEPRRFDPIEIEIGEASALIFRGAIAAAPPDEDFGGFSGLERMEDGSFVAISDRAVWLRFKLLLREGRLAGLSNMAVAPLRDAAGRRASGEGWDAEGLAFGPDGRLWASFERDHRLVAFKTPGAPAGEEARLPEWKEFSLNGGMEALATTPDGRRLAVRESADGDAFGGYLLGEAAERFAIARDGPYAPTGADFGPEGRLYLTERAFSFFGGFRFRLRRFDEVSGGATLSGETLLELPSQSLIDNIEGVSVWREGGRTYLLLVSDDNFMALQRNVFALFEVVD